MVGGSTVSTCSKCAGGATGEWERITERLLPVCTVGGYLTESATTQYERQMNVGHLSCCIQPLTARRVAHQTHITAQSTIYIRLSTFLCTQTALPCITASASRLSFPPSRLVRLEYNSHTDFGHWPSLPCSLPLPPPLTACAPLRLVAPLCRPTPLPSMLHSQPPTVPPSPLTSPTPQPLSHTPASNHASLPLAQPPLALTSCPPTTTVTAYWPAQPRQRRGLLTCVRCVVYSSRMRSGRWRTSWTIRRPRRRGERY